MRQTMLETAMRLMQGGQIPSVSDVAEAAKVSRATAYRYFPSQAEMIKAVGDEALGPILGWASTTSDPEKRVDELLAFSYPRIAAYEATHRAVLLMALDQWTRRQAGTLGDELPIVRGRRVALLRNAAAPLREALGEEAFDKLTQSLSLVFGAEAFIVLKDIWGLDLRAAQNVAIWAAHALVRAAIHETAGRQEPGTRQEPGKGSGKRLASQHDNAAPRPRRANKETHSSL